MTDLSPDPAAPPPVTEPVLDPGGAPQVPRRASRLGKHPLIRVAAAVVGLALG